MMQKNPKFRRSVLARSVLIAMGASTFFAGVAQAQANLERITVTGSAIKRIDAETAVPITVVKMEELKKQGISTVEQILSSLSVVQASTGTSQVIGSGTGGASFADIRGLGSNKTLILLNGRRVANNSISGAAPDMNMIPFASIERVEVLRDGASALYGTDAIGGVINFITRNDFTGGSITVGADRPVKEGGRGRSVNIGGGIGNIDTDGFNVFGFIDSQHTGSISGVERDYNKRYPGGLSPTPYPANYYQAGDVGNPAAPGCVSPILISAGPGAGCTMTTSAYVDYAPIVDRQSGFLKGTIKVSNDMQVGLEYFTTKSVVEGQIAPVPYGGLIMNRVRPDGSLNPYYPGNPGAIAAGIALDPNWAGPNVSAAKGVLPGYITVKWRDLFHGPRGDINTNVQQRLAATLEGNAAGWDYQAGATMNRNKVDVSLKGYSDGVAITKGMREGVLNPFGAQSAAGQALLEATGLSGPQQIAETTANVIDARASREIGDWFGAGRKVAVAVGVSNSREDLYQVGSDYDLNVKRVSSTGFDPDTNNRGARTVSAVYTEFNLPVTKAFEVTAAARYDNYSDFGNTTNPKLGFRYQPSQEMLFRGSASTGFRAPSLYDLYSATAYTNTPQINDPVNCPGGVLAPGKIFATSCKIQVQALTGGNTTLSPEKSTNMTLGVMLEPTKNLSLGMDLWSIQLTNQIGSVAASTVFADPATFSKLYHRNGSGYFSTDGSECPGSNCGYVDLRTQNLGGLNTNGVDLSGRYRLNMGSAGNVVFGLQSTFVNKYEYQDYTNGPWNQNAGVYVGVGPIFKWTHNLSVNWSQGNVAAGLAAHYKSDYVDYAPADNGNPVVSAYTTWDSYISWSPMKALSLTLGVRNMLDAVPPLSYQEQTFQAGYDPRYSDTVGRSYYVRGTFQF
jgi:iron complex outermembrane receptor protein